MADRIGQQLGNYQLIQLLGKGTFAEVYLGGHIHLGTLAAVKVMYTQLTREDFISFRIEARIIAHLIHPNIVRVLEFGIEGETSFLVMDFAPGGTLRQCYPKGTLLPLITIVSYVKQIADALQYAHDERLIHRDVKPENILLGRRNEVLLSDFGIAILAQSSRSQSPISTAGTMAYTAPEQIQGRPCPASDQYSLGIVVYEWLCGTYPFRGSSAIEVAMKHLSAPPQPLHDIVPSISPAVEQVVLKALAKNPERRFASMSDFTAALEQASFADDSGALTQPSPGSDQPPPPITRTSSPGDSLPTLPAGPSDDALPTLN
jgi:eukaryotic-like serine/threonine-protein kinase